jgi:uncharacterized protein
MLFGAGVILFVSRLQKRADGMAPADYFIRRQLWLLVFGLFDGYILLWDGDILFGYAVCGIVVFAFRNLQPKYLLIAAGICLVLMTARDNVNLYRHKIVLARGERIEKLDTTKTKLTDRQKEELAALSDLRASADSATLQKETAKNLRNVRGSFADAYRTISPTAFEFETLETYYGIWDILIFMFIGMAFFKTGILTGSASARTYAWFCAIGLALGIVVTYSYLQPPLKYHFNRIALLKNVWFEYYEIARLFRSLGLFGLIMLLYNSGRFKGLFALARPVGQMAFTNYLMQSILCGLFFYGIGLGMYGHLERYQLYYVVTAVWVIETAWSHIWLRYFQFGPLEWLWRSLTYWKRQPLKR